MSKIVVMESSNTGDGKTRSIGKRPKTKKKGTYHHGDLRRALLDAALLMVEREGPKGLSLRAVARLAGVSPAAPYRHFSGKEGLLAAVAKEGLNALAESMESASAENVGLALAEFRAIALAYVKFAAANPSHFRVMFGPEVTDRAQHEGLMEASERSFGILVRVIQSTQRSGLEGAEADPRRLAISAWAAFHGLATLVVDNQIEGPVESDSDLAVLTNSVTDVIYRGLSYSGL